MRIRIVAIGTLLLLSAALTAAVQNGNDLYQQGLARETAGDIKGAVQIFERIVRDFSSNRTLTAKALVQLGRWSDLLGQDQARKHYERVIREFADQKEAAAEAKARLDVLAKVAAPGASPARRLIVDWGDWSRKMGDTRMSLTRDGRYLLRYNEKQRAFEQIEISSGDVRQLATEGPNPADELVDGNAIELSPDGRKFAAGIAVLQKPQPVAATGPQFERFELRIFEVGARGTGRALGRVQNAGEQGGAFAWSPRGDRIWMFSIRSDLSAQIRFVDMNGKLEVLKTLTWRDLTQVPSLSSDGRFLAYHDAPGRQTPPDVYILATDGSSEYRIEHPADDSRPMFLPDGSGIVFVSNRRGVSDLWFQALKDGRPVDQPRVVWRGAQPFGVARRFADNGSLFYYFAVNDWGTYTVPLDLNAAAGSIGAPKRLAPLANETNSGAAFSPDGQYLAHFRSNAARLVIRELASGVEREIPFGAQLQASYARVEWCSNGDSLLALGYIDGVGTVAYRVLTKDSSIQRLSVPASTYPIAVCIGDDMIYSAVPRNGPGSITRRSLTTGRETTIFEGAVRAVARSKDGNRLAVMTADASGASRLITMSATGGEVSANLMPLGATPLGSQRIPLVQNVAWISEGDRLLVALYDQRDSVANESQPSQWPLYLWEVPLTGASPRKLGLVPLPKVNGLFYGATSFTVHPDGKHLAFQSHEGLVQQTWAIDNLAQFIKAGGGW
jgi:hypothetical protein